MEAGARNAVIVGSLRLHQDAPSGSFWRKLVAFLGPGYLVAVGYMDPGNWATSLAGGSNVRLHAAHRRAHLNVMAILLQALCARLGIGAGRDLAQACATRFPAGPRGRSGW
jgi:manganese transport protein